MMAGDVEVRGRSCCGMENSLSLGSGLVWMCSPTNDVDVYKRGVEMVGDGMWDSSGVGRFEESQGDVLL